MVMNMTNPLLNAYVNVCFRLSEQDLADWRGDTAVIITAWNPRSVRLAQSQNHQRNHDLKSDLDHFRMFKLLVGNENFDWFEESYWVDISLKGGLTLAEKYQQNAIYWVDKKQVFLVYSVDKQLIYIGEIDDFLP